MKFIRIFLLVLIIIGIFALVTQKTWVPKLVSYILKSEKTADVIPVQQNIALEDGRQCYTYSQEATDTEPYSVSEFIDITITSSKVVGTKTGTQSGPGMTNGYSGTLIGTSTKDSIMDTFSYIIEGSHGSEEEIYKTGLTGIEKLRYPLIEEKGILVPDTSKEFSVIKYARVGCTGSN